MAIESVTERYGSAQTYTTIDASFAFQRGNAERKPGSLRACPMDIGNTSVRRSALLATIAVAKRFRPRRESVLFLTGTLCVKYGDLVNLSEALALQFIAAHTSIPVPKVYCAFTHKGCTYILMERIKGDTLIRGWGSRSEESKAKIFSQLKKMVDEMRRLPAPGHGISDVVGGPLYDERFAGPTSMVGPFETIHDFHLFLRNGFTEPVENYPEINDMMRLQDRHWPMPVFTHGDLSAFNILVRGDDVVGIIDWETAGWYPTYWEYTMACLQGNRMFMWWTEESDRFLDAMPEEVVMENLRLKYFGLFPSFR